MAPPAGAEAQVTPSSDLASSLPAPILRLLVLFARPIAGLRALLEIACWKTGRRVESWVVVGLWWATCLGSRYLFRWLLPPLLFLPLLPLESLRLGSRTVPKKQGPSNPTSQEVLLLTLSDLHAIHVLLPPSPLPTLESVYSRFALLGPLRLSRGLLIIWATWVVLGHIVGYAPLLAILGSVILLLPSPTLAHVYALLSRSLLVRRALALAFLFTFGSPPDQSYPLSMHFSPIGWVKSKWAVSRRPSLAFTFRPNPLPTPTAASESAIIDDDEDERGMEPIYFRFEVHENQRWWMGLDWTSALLPQERPSWCDSHLLPASPPASFVLPSSSSVILPHATKVEPKGRVQRIATWKWLDDDWIIIRAGAGAAAPSSSSNIIHSPTIPEDDGQGYSVPSQRSLSSVSSPPPPIQSIAEQAFTKGLERLKRTAAPTTTGSRPSSMIVGSPGRSSGEFKRVRTGSQTSEDAKDLDLVAAMSGSAPLLSGETVPEKDDATDADGWVYGDNKWESMGPKGGLGRFTRRRRWQRRAILTETAHKLPPGSLDEPVSPLKAAPVTAPSPVAAQVGPSLDSQATEEKQRRGSSTDRSRTSDGVPIPSASPTRDDMLRQRLKKAMGNVGG